MKEKNDDPLPQELVNALAGAIPNGALEQQQVERLRERVLERIREGKSAYLTIHAAEGPWQELYPLVDVKVLHQEERTTSMLMRLRPAPSCPRIYTLPTRSAWSSKANSRSEKASP